MMRTAFVFLALASARLVYAYDESGTHRRLSRASFDESVLRNNPAFDRTIGSSLTDKSKLPGTAGPESARELIATGSHLEDVNFARKASHFFNPLALPGEEGLSVLGGSVCPGTFFGATGCYPSSDWALEDAGQSFENSDPDKAQHNSLADAKEFFRQALASPQKADREKAFANVFESLGHVLHMIQDAAQPQHVRNEVHLHPDEWYKDYVFDVIEVFGNIVGATWFTSRFEPDTRDTYGKGLGPAYAGRYGANPNSAANASPAIGRPRDVWKASGQGIAEFTNRNFVTEHTNFRAPYMKSCTGGACTVAATAADGFPAPNGEGVLTTLTYAQLKEAFPPFPNEVPFFEPPDDFEIDLVATPVADLVEGTTETAYTSTLSLLDGDLSLYPCVIDFAQCTQAHFSLSYVNFQQARDLLLPRAISYGTALINHFFRGVFRDGHPVLRLNAADIGTPQGSVSVTNDSNQPLHGGDLVVYYDRLPTEQRVELLSVDIDMAAGQSVTIGDSATWTTLVQSMQPGGQVVFLYTGQIGNAPNDVSVAGRVCDCSQLRAADLDGTLSDADAECLNLCPCKYLAFVEGDPGAPGDGVSIVPTLGGLSGRPRQDLTPIEPLLFAGYPGGLTVSVYSGDSTNLFSWVAFGLASASQTCTGNGWVPLAEEIGTVEANGVVGRRVVYRPSDLEFFSNLSLDSPCRYRLCYDPSAIPCGVFSCGCTPVTIDAVVVCPGVPSP